MRSNLVERVYLVCCLVAGAWGAAGHRATSRVATPTHPAPPPAAPVPPYGQHPPPARPPERRRREVGGRAAIPARHPHEAPLCSLPGARSSGIGGALMLAALGLIAAAPLNRHYGESSTKWHSRRGAAAACFPKAGIKQTRRQCFANNLICLML